MNSLPKLYEIAELITYASLNHLKTYFITNCLSDLNDIYGKYTFSKIANIVNLEEVTDLRIDTTNEKSLFPIREETNIKIINIEKIFK